MSSPESNASIGQPLLPLTPWILWAKWSRHSSKPFSYHSVLCHLIDVAVSTEALWRQVMPWRWKEHIANALGMQIAAAERWVVFWAGLHDLGKVCPGFQLQLEQSNKPAHAIIRRWLQAAGLPWRQAPWIAHGAVSALALQSILPAEYQHAQQLANVVAFAIGGHHGLFQSYKDLDNLPSDSVGDGLWDNARLRYAQWLAEALALSPSSAPAVETLDHPTAMKLAGLVSVADWIGSSEEFFPHYVPDANHPPALDAFTFIQTYRDFSRQQAHKALDTLGWTGWTPSKAKKTFQEIFPTIQQMRPVQETIVALAEELTGPAIVVIESPMGEGKTEAAFYLADHWSVTQGQRGLYFALPTQATSDSMFERIRRFLLQRYPSNVVNLQLLHGHAALSDTLKDLHAKWKGLLTPGNIYAGNIRPQTAQGEVVAAEWFSSGKKAILAPFGVGTVDQVLLAALQIMHVFVRLYGLSTKTIIIDEVHAYDTYMSTLMERLLEWLGAFEVPVVLLSATLPSKRRQALIAAYAKGAGWRDASPESTTSYPRITWASATGCDVRETRVSALNHQIAVVEWLSGTLPEPDAKSTNRPLALGERLKDLLADGGCAAVICNTVNRAQRIYEALKPYFPGDADDSKPILDLFHAAYPYEERFTRQQRAITRFDQNGPRPDCAVLVATQVIEQSLDLDFDVMVTDLAPVDLILQRMGRLHRHLRPRVRKPETMDFGHLDEPRPLKLQTSRLILLMPDDHPDGTPAFDGGSKAVYDLHILLRSYLALKERLARQQQQLTLPGDIEPLIEQVYGDMPCPADASSSLTALWDTSLADLEKSHSNNENEAKNRYIARPSLDAPLFEIVRHPREEDAPELCTAFRALTRLGESVSVICLAGTEEQPLLRPDGPTVNLHHQPSISEVEALLNRSVSLSNEWVVRELLGCQVPDAWQKVALLCNHRYLIFNADGIARLNGLHIQLHPKLGIIIG